MADNKIQQPIKLRVTAGTPARAADFNRLSEAVDALISQKQLFRGFVNDAEINALCTSSHFGVYYYLSSTPSPDTLIGSGLLTVGFGNDMSIISQTLLLGATPVFANDGVTITEFQNSPSVLFRTYKDGQWGAWSMQKQQAVPDIPQPPDLSEYCKVVAMEQDDLERLTAADCEEGVLYLGLGEVLSTERVWTFGSGTFPLVFHK